MENTSPYTIIPDNFREKRYNVEVVSNLNEKNPECCAARWRLWLLPVYAISHDASSFVIATIPKWSKRIGILMNSE